jgi:hypothetical protein
VPGIVVALGCRSQFWVPLAENFALYYTPEASERVVFVNDDPEKIRSAAIVASTNFFGTRRNRIEARAGQPFGLERGG